MKQCNEPNCTLPVFGGLKCKYHQHKRTDKPNKTKIKPVKPRSFKKCTNTKAKQNNSFKTTKTELLYSFGFNSQIEMFNQIWDERPHICQISGSNLDLVPKNRYVWMFAHVLNKKNYPLWKFNPENILLLHPDVHYCVDNFTEDMRKKYEYNFDLWFDLVNFKKQKYLEFLKENMI